MDKEELYERYASDPSVFIDIQKIHNEAERDSQAKHSSQVANSSDKIPDAKSNPTYSPLSMDVFSPEQRQVMSTIELLRLETEPFHNNHNPSCVSKVMR